MKTYSELKVERSKLEAALKAGQNVKAELAAVKNAMIVEENYMLAEMEGNDE